MKSISDQIADIKKKKKKLFSFPGKSFWLNYLFIHLKLNGLSLNNLDRKIIYF
jgi:hypothetical protein